MSEITLKTRFKVGQVVFVNSTGVARVSGIEFVRDELRYLLSDGTRAGSHQLRVNRQWHDRIFDELNWVERSERVAFLKGRVCKYGEVVGLRLKNGNASHILVKESDGTISKHRNVDLIHPTDMAKIIEDIAEASVYVNG